jgi:hypothetical protein
MAGTTARRALLKWLSLTSTPLFEGHACEKRSKDQKTSTRKKRYVSNSPHQFDSGLPQTAALGRSAEMAKMRRLK